MTGFYKRIIITLTIKQNVRIEQLDPNLTGTPITPPSDQPMRAEVHAAGDINEMLKAFSNLVKGRPGWYQNEEEMIWFFYPSKVNEPVIDQKTTFSESEYILPEETAQIDQYLVPLMDEMQKILQNQPNWQYNDAEKGWVFEKPGIFSKIKSIFES